MTFLRERGKNRRLKGKYVLGWFDFFNNNKKKNPNSFNGFSNKLEVRFASGLNLLLPPWPQCGLRAAESPGNLAILKKPQEVCHF